jgi:hypothetical protein
MEDKPAIFFFYSRSFFSLFYLFFFFFTVNSQLHEAPRHLFVGHRIQKKKSLSYFFPPQKRSGFFLLRPVFGFSLPRRIKERLFGGLFLRFLESFFGAQVFFFFVRNAWLNLASSILTQEYLFAKRISQYGSSGLRHRKSSWWWGSRLLALAVRSRDPELVVSWLQTRLKHMSLYAHRRFFRLLGLLLRGAVRARGAHSLRGFYLRVVGKISVVGNAMSRVWWTRGGLAAGSNLTLQVFQGFSLVRTTTGCLGLSFFFFY